MHDIDFLPDGCGVHIADRANLKGGRRNEKTEKTYRKGECKKERDSQTVQKEGWSQLLLGALARVCEIKKERLYESANSSARKIIQYYCN